MKEHCGERCEEKGLSGLNEQNVTRRGMGCILRG